MELTDVNPNDYEFQMDYYVALRNYGVPHDEALSYLDGEKVAYEYAPSLADMVHSDALVVIIAVIRDTLYSSFNYLYEYNRAVRERYCVTLTMETGETCVLVPPAQSAYEDLSFWNVVPDHLLVSPYTLADVLIQKGWQLIPAVPFNLSEDVNVIFMTMQENSHRLQKILSEIMSNKSGIDSFLSSLTGENKSPEDALTDVMDILAGIMSEKPGINNPRDTAVNHRIAEKFAESMHIVTDEEYDILSQDKDDADEEDWS